MVVRKKTIKLQDRISLKDSSRIRTPEGYLIVKAHIARTGIQEYLGNDLPGMGLDPNKTYKIYRPAEEVFAIDTLKSFARKPVTNEHPYDTGGLVDAKTATKKMVGVSGDEVKPDGDKILTSLTIYDSAMVDRIEAGKVGLSAGYQTDLDMTPGEYKGEAYDGKQTNIRGNHTAVCDVAAARGGTECRILDKKRKKRIVDMKKRAAYDDEMDVPDLSDINQVGQLIMKLHSRLAGIEKMLSQKSETETDEEDMPKNGISKKDFEEEDDEVDSPESEDMGSEEHSMDDEDEEEVSKKKKLEAADDEDEEEEAEMKKKGTKTTDSLIRVLKKKISYLEGKMEASTQSKKVALDARQTQLLVSKRVKLLRDAEKVLPGVALDSLDDLAIKKKVIKHIYPNTALDKRSAENINGLYEGALEAFSTGTNSAARLAGAIVDSHANYENIKEDLSFIDSGDMVAAAREKFMKKSRDAWKGGKK